MLGPEIQVFGMASEESNKALVIGNGESRRDVNLIQFNNFKIIGCNAIHRDVQVDYLVCCDRRMADEAVKNVKFEKPLIYVRAEWYRYFRKTLKHKNIQELPLLPFKGELKKDQPQHWGSGCYAVLLAATFEFKEIWLLGFDLYSENNQVNNIYKNTQHYSKDSSPAVDYSFWVYQISKIFRHFNDKKFIVINKQNWIFPDSWVLENVEFKNIEQITVDS